MRESASLSQGGMSFINISLSLDKRRSTVEQQAQQRNGRKLRIRKIQQESNTAGNSNTLFRPFFDSLAHLTVESLYNETDIVRLSNYQSNLFNSLIASAFSGDQANQYNAALNNSSDPIISQMSFKSFSYDQSSNNNGSNTNDNNTVTTKILALAPAWIAVICVVGAAILVAVVAFLWYRRIQKRRAENMVKQVITPTSSPSRSAKDSFSPDNDERHEDRPEDEDSSEDKEQHTMEVPFRTSPTASERYRSDPQHAEGPLQTNSFDSQNSAEHTLTYCYSVDQFTGPQKQDAEQKYLKSCASVSTASTCTADVIELMNTIEILDAKVTKLEVEERKADVAIFRDNRKDVSVSPVIDQDNFSTASTEATAGASKNIHDAVESKTIQPSNSFEGRGCASAVTNPYTMRGRQIILPNKSYDSQASVISTPFSVVDMRTKDTFRIRKTVTDSPISAATHAIYNVPADTNVLRTISSDASESTGEHETPLGPPQIHRATGNGATPVPSESFETQVNDDAPIEFCSTHSVVTIKMANSYDKHDLVSESAVEHLSGIPKNVGIVIGKTETGSNDRVNQRRSSNPIFQSLRNWSKLKVTQRNKVGIPPPPRPIPPPPPIESDMSSGRSLNQVNSHQQDEEAFDVLERNGSFEVDEKSCEGYPSIHPEEISQAVSPTESHNQPYLTTFAVNRRLKSPSMLRPKPSEMTEASFDPYRRLGRRNKRCSVVQEGDNEEESNETLSNQDNLDEQIMDTISDDELSDSEASEDAVSDAAIAAPLDAMEKEEVSVSYQLLHLFFYL